MITTKQPIVEVVNSISNVYFANEAGEVFTAFHEADYDKVVQDIMVSKFGNRDMLFTDEEISEEVYEQTIFAYLFPRWRYIAQCMAYLAAEYNPIENYSGTEHEETEYDIKERKFTKGSQDNTRTEPTDVTQVIEGQHTDTVTPAAKTVATTTDKQTTTNKVAPFDSSDFSNRDQTIVEGQQTGGGTLVNQVTSQQEADSYTYAQKTDTTTSHYGMADGYQITDHEGQRIDTDQAHKDVTTRDLTRTGNIGVMTAAQMMVSDEDFWKKFAWLDEIAHSLAVLLAESVWAM